MEHEQEPIKALHVGDMKIAGMEIPCAVLKDERRVITEHGIAAILGGRSGASKRIKYTGRDEGRAPLPLFLAPKRLKPYVDKHLGDGPLEPITYAWKSQSFISYDCRILPRVCRIWVEAALMGDLQTQQLSKTIKALDFLSGLGETGIIGLVDEATGYQDVRAKDALAKILEEFLVNERQKWTKTFPIEFYKEIYRLRNWEWKPWTTKRPSVIAKWTDDFVYERIAPGILTELRELNPKNASGNRSARHHQWFNPENGHPKLKEHLSGVTALMRAASTWPGFKRSLQRAYPRFDETMPLPLSEPDHE